MLTVTITILLTLPMLWLLRWTLSGRITTLMGRSSPSAGDPLSAFAETPETAMSTVPRLEILDAASVPPEASATRAAAARTARRIFGRWWCTEALAVLGYSALSGTALFAVDVDPVENGLAFALVPAIYLLIVSLRYVFWVRQYTAVRSSARMAGLVRFVGMIILALPRALLHPGNAWLPFLLCAGGVIGLGTGYLAETADTVFAGIVVLGAALLGVALHVWLLLRFRASVPAEHAPHVAMLRVFGIDRNAYFTFGSMLDSWKHFGPSFTIIDPAFFRYRYRSFSAGNVGMVLWLGTLVGLVIFGLIDESEVAMTEDEAALQDPALQVGAGVAAAVLMTIGYAIRMVWLLVALPAHFVKDAEQIDARMTGIDRRPRHFDMTFRNVHMFCHDNTWRVAVDQFVSRADIVLMDLRGYTPERQGCEYEVDFLFDKAPIDRVLFLIDAHTDADAVGRLIRDRWAELRITSPNLSDPDPVARVYRTGGAARGDVRGLLDLMFAAAERQPDSAPMKAAA